MLLSMVWHVAEGGVACRSGWCGVLLRMVLCVAEGVLHVAEDGVACC